MIKLVIINILLKYMSLDIFMDLMKSYKIIIKSFAVLFICLLLGMLIIGLVLFFNICSEVFQKKKLKEYFIRVEYFFFLFFFRLFCKVKDDYNSLNDALSVFHFFAVLKYSVFLNLLTLVYIRVFVLFESGCSGKPSPFSIKKMVEAGLLEHTVAIELIRLGGNEPQIPSTFLEVVSDKNALRTIRDRDVVRFLEELFDEKYFEYSEKHPARKSHNFGYAYKYVNEEIYRFIVHSMKGYGVEVADREDKPRTEFLKGILEYREFDQVNSLDNITIPLNLEAAIGTSDFLKIMYNPMQASPIYDQDLSLAANTFRFKKFIAFRFHKEDIFLNEHFLIKK